MKTLAVKLAATANAYALLLAALAAPAPAAARPARSGDAAAQQQARPATPAPSPAPSPQQTPSPAPTEVDEDEVVRITTNLVQVDAVVTDKQGRQVTDLRPEDFEILEDGKPQPITNFSYVAAAPAAERPTPAASPSRPGEAAPPTTARARREQVRRTIAVVVDDLGMAFANLPGAKRALRKFIDERVEPGDLVAVIRTGGEVGALQQFTTDKRQMRAAVERIRWNNCSRRGIQGVSSPTSFDSSFGLPPCADPLQSVKQSLNALSFIVGGMRDLPGRKSLILFSDSLPINVPDPEEYSGFSAATSARPQNDDPGAVRPPEFRRNDRPTAANQLQSLTEVLLRASIVVYSIDTRGLTTDAVTDLLNSMGTMTSKQIADAWARSPVRKDELAAGEVPQALTSRTGGFAVRNLNDIPRALDLIMEDLRGYYLLGYRPRSETFDRRFHRIEARVRNRPDLRVRTRRGFFGVPEGERAAPRTAADRFLLALTSPFGAGDIDVRLTPVFAETPEQGPFLRALLHIDPGGLTFTPEAGGWEKSEIVLRGILFGDNGRVAEDHRQAFALRVRGDTLRHIRQHGLEYTFHVPAKKPGPYQLRVAVLDRATSRVGSAGQFMEVPDLKKKRLAVSGIVVSGVNPADAAADAGAGRRDAAPEGAAESRPDPEASPSVRRFRQNAQLEYSFVVYNARAAKDGRPSLLSQTRLYHEGRLVFSGEERPATVEGQADLTRLTAGGRMSLGNGLPPGEYVLQVVVRDALARGEQATATQWIDFEVIK